MKLVYSLVTRGRPQSLIETLSRNLNCLSLPNTKIIIQADADDRATIDAVERVVLNGQYRDPRVFLNVAPREDTIAGKTNRAMSEPADLYVVGADDDPPITPGWDAAFLEAAKRFPDGIGAVYGHLQNASFPSPYGFTAKLVEMLGYIQPAHFPYWFCDHWTDDVARIIGRISVADVRTDPSKSGKTQEMREPAWWATWFDAAYLMRRREAHSIINAREFDSPSWLKEILRTHHPIIEYRSRWINDNVRAQARQLEQWSGLSNRDERYQRVRAKAGTMVTALLDGMDAKEADAFRTYLTPPTEVVGLRRAFA